MLDQLRVRNSSTKRSKLLTYVMYLLEDGFCFIFQKTKRERTDEQHRSLVGASRWFTTYPASHNGSRDRGRRVRCQDTSSRAIGQEEPVTWIPRSLSRELGHHTRCGRCVSSEGLRPLEEPHEDDTRENREHGNDAPLDSLGVHVLAHLISHPVDEYFRGRNGDGWNLLRFLPQPRELLSFTYG